MRKIAFVLTGLVALTFFSCEDSAMDEGEIVTEVSSLDLTTEVTSESAMEDTDVISDAGFDSFTTTSFSGRAFRDEVLDCATVENDTVNNIITIDYGEEGCEGRRGRVRKGKIIIEYSGRRFQEGSFRQVTFEDFFVDSTQIEGTRTITVTEVDTVENTVTFDITLEGGKLTFGDGTTATRESRKSRTWFRGQGFATVIGSANGVTREGENYTVEITEELVFRRACWNPGVFVPVSGVKEYTVGEVTSIIDYGEGDCDNVATVTTGDSVEEVELQVRGRKRRRIFG